MSFRQYLYESSDMLDISILNADKASPRSLVLAPHYRVEEKLDGTKLSIVLFNGNVYVSYKNSLIFSDEIEADADLARASIGVSQYKIVWNRINQNLSRIKRISGNWEYFAEFLMDKPTLTRSYHKKHDIVLLAKSPITRLDIQGISIRTNPSQFITDVDSDARIFGFDRPAVLFDGNFTTYQNFRDGAISRNLIKILDEIDPQLYDNLSVEDKYHIIKDVFLRVESAYGGTSEGVVLKSKTKYYKFLQSDQHDKTVRSLKSAQYKMDADQEKEYWSQVQLLANQVKDLARGEPIDRRLKEVNRAIQRMRRAELPQHSKKNVQTIKDDVYLTAKLKVNRMEPGNNNALVLGKFRVFTEGHKKMIDTALKGSDGVVIAVVSSRDKKSKETISLRKRMIAAVYPEAYIIEASTGNIVTILNKSKKNVNKVYAGSDRIESYKSQLDRSPDVTVNEIRRNDADVSATKVIEVINNDDFATFRTLTPPQVHPFWNELKITYGE